MSLLTHRPISAEEYARAAADYLANETVHDMSESTPSFLQRGITVSSLDALRASHRPEVQTYGELLVQFPTEDGPGLVVPDNFVMLDPSPMRTLSSFIATETERPFWVIEYVSPASEHKDYEVSFEKYEQQLKTPYYLSFDPLKQDLRLLQHNGVKYEPVEPNAEGRMAIRELDLEIGLLDGWVRYWHRGKLLEIPKEMTRRIADQERALIQKERALDRQKKMIGELTEEKELLKDENEQLSQGLQQQLTRMRARVARLASKSGRTELLSPVETAGFEQLNAWLDELE